MATKIHQKMSVLCPYAAKIDTDRLFMRAWLAKKSDQPSIKVFTPQIINILEPVSPPPLKIDLLALYGSGGSSAVSMRVASGDEEEKSSYLKIACIALAVLAFAGLGALAYRRYYAPA